MEEKEKSLSPKAISWLNRVMEAEESGQSMADWCRSNGVVCANLKYWKRKAKENGLLERTVSWRRIKTMEDMRLPLFVTLRREEGARAVHCAVRPVERPTLQKLATAAASYPEGSLEKGDLFLFVDQSRRRMYGLYVEEGYCLFQKQLTERRYCWPAVVRSDGRAVLKEERLRRLLGEGGGEKKEEKTDENR